MVEPAAPGEMAGAAAQTHLADRRPEGTLMNAIPPPTANERYLFGVHIGPWDEQTPVQQGIGLGVIRGHNSLAKLEQYLGLSAAELWPELRGLSGGLRWSGPDTRIQLG